MAMEQPGGNSRSKWRERFIRIDAAVTDRLSRPVEATDRYFAARQEPLLKTPKPDLRLGLFGNFEEGGASELEFHPNVEIDVELPNIERRLRLFVESSRDNELPGRQPGALEENQISIGFRRWFEKADISTDAGIRARIWPKVFARISWRPLWETGGWSFRPEQRLFADTEEGLGTRTGLDIRRRLGRMRRGQVRSVTAGKWTTEKELFTWEQSLRFGFVESLRGGRRGLDNYGWGDTKKAQGVKFSVYGEDGRVTGYRSMLGFRGPILDPWLFWEIDPGLEWERENDFEATYRILAGIEVLFGAGSAIVD